MFRKLVKHDIRDSCFEPLILSLIAVGLCALAAVSISLNSETLFSIIIVAASIVNLALIGVTVRAIVKNFHTKLFTNNGYLTLTTPISIDTTLLSKIIASMLCVLINIFAAFFGFLIIFVAIFGAGFDAAKVLLEFGQNIVQNPLEAIKLVIFCLAYILYAITILMFVLALTNTGRMQKNKWLKGVLIYVGLSFFMQLFAEVRGTNGEWVNFGMNILFSVVFYFVSRYLIVNKLELE